MVSPRARWFAHTRASILLGSGLAVVLVVGLFASGMSATASPTIPPASGALFGAYVQTTGNFVDGITAFENKLGRKLAIVNKYHNWTMTNFSDEAKLIASGHVVMVSWHPTDNLAGDPTMASKVVSGQYDSLIRTAADNMKPLGNNVLLRWDFEMTQLPGQPENVGPPAEFIAAWRHMHDIFVARGATNVKWVWAPQSAGFSHGTAAPFYPGDAYVDWIEASDVMGGLFWSSFDKLFTPMYQWAAPRGKPLLVWVGLPENPSDSNWKENWFSGMRATIKNSMPAVKGVLYYQAHDRAGNFLADTTPQSWASFRSMALDRYFNPGSGGPSPTQTSSPAPPSSKASVPGGADHGRGAVTGDPAGISKNKVVPLPAHSRAGSTAQKIHPQAFAQPFWRRTSAGGLLIGLLLLLAVIGLIGTWLFGHRGLGITSPT